MAAVRTSEQRLDDYEDCKVELTTLPALRAELRTGRLGATAQTYLALDGRSASSGFTTLRFRTQTRPRAESLSSDRGLNSAHPDAALRPPAEDVRAEPGHLAIEDPRVDGGIRL